MPEQVQSTPTLLTLTAPKPPRPDEPRKDAAEFSAKLASAVEGVEAKPAVKDQAASKTPEATQAAAAAAASTEAEVATDEDAAEVDADGAELLATFVVTETIVLETPPDAVLPDNAVTSIDVGSGVTLDAASGDGDASAGAIDTATVPAPGSEAAILQAPSPQASALTAGEAHAATGATDADGAATAAPASAVAQPLDGDAPSSPLGEGDASATQAASTTGGSAEPSAEAGKASTTHPAAEPPASLDPSATTATALAAAASPAGPARDPDDSKAPDATDKVDASLADGAPSRYGARAESADEASSAGGPAFDPARFVSRVSRAIETAAERGGPVEIRLSPPELGSLQVKIQVKDGAMTAKLEVETPAARNAVLDNLPALRDRLEQQQIRIDKFDVEVRDNQQQRGGDWRQHQDQQQADPQQPRGESRPLRPPTASATTPVDTRAVRTTPFAGNGINLVV